MMPCCLVSRVSPRVCKAPADGLPDGVRRLLHCAQHILANSGHAAWQAGRGRLRATYGGLAVSALRQAGAPGRVQQLATVARDVWFAPRGRTEVPERAGSPNSPDCLSKLRQNDPVDWARQIRKLAGFVWRRIAARLPCLNLRARYVSAHELDAFGTAFVSYEALSVAGLALLTRLT